MFRVLECITQQHDYRFVLIAALVCLLGNTGLFIILKRAGFCVEARRGHWLAVAAVAEGTVHSVKMTTRKPPNGLSGAPHLVKNGISVEGLNEPKLVFSGTARDAAAGFPANVNVVAALALAGIGPDRTMIDIWADPTKTRNCHVIEVDADSASFTLSIIATLRKLTAPLRVGT